MIGATIEAGGAGAMAGGTAIDRIQKKVSESLAQRAEEAGSGPPLVYSPGVILD